jgi:hypothetical protein
MHDIDFKWFEAFSSTLKKKTNCIQYEKAAVLWNVAGLYSQLAANQRHWSDTGRKQASSYFQHAAGVILFIRDIVCPQFKNKLDASNDLHDTTLTGCATLMLAQASECYYEKANEGTYHFNNFSWP